MSTFPEEVLPDPGDRFGESGSAGELLHKYQLDAEGIYEQIKAFINK